MTMRNTGMNRLGGKNEKTDQYTGKLSTYGRNDQGQKVKVVTDRANNRDDRYWGGKGKTDGAGHGHTWNNHRDGQYGTRQPK